jgi:ABC-2 type transport system permease protein
VKFKVNEMSKAITEKRDDSPPGLRWEATAELAPSTILDTAPVLSRWIGALGLALLVLGGVSLLVHLSGRSTIIDPTWGSLLAFVGLGGLLFHAANDAELQIRRAYMYFGFLWLAAGVALTLYPYKAPGTETAAIGSLFLPYGASCLLIGLFFTLAFVRNETEARMHELAVYAVGGLGAALAVAGFIGGTMNVHFLVPFGVVLVPLGFAFLWAFISMRGIVDEWGYRAALAIGLAGLIVFLVALGRSVLPPLLEKMKLLTPGTPQYIMPSGLLLMAGGLLYVLLSAAYVSDRQVVVLTRRELGSLFFSPLAYFVILGYTLLGWQIFASFVLNSLWRMDPLGGAGAPRAALEPIVINYIISWFPVICVLILVPVLTMRLLSEEQRTGTLEMTLTAPVEETVVVVSKFLAALIFFMLVWVPWGLFLVSLKWWGVTEFDYRPLIGFLVALLFSGSAFVSMGVFFSSLTKNQLAAAVLTFVGMFLLTFIFFLKQDVPETDVKNIVLTHISYVDLWLNVLQGKLASRDLVIWLSAAIFWLFLSVKVLESRKWR